MNRKRLTIIIPFLAIVLGGLVYFKIYSNSAKVQGNTATPQINKEEALVITPQSPKDQVIVKSATLNKNGFLVVRQMDDGKLSQVIEMSKPLKAGKHKNVSISLGYADIKGKELIVMIYEDYDNDEVFNDLDMPALDENGTMTANYVKTGMPLPSTITEGESAGMVHNMAGMKSMAKVRYTDKGFTPEKVEVPVGSAVEFINESSIDMWVASSLHPSHMKLPTFDQFKPYKKGAIYRYVFDKKGVWEFHDHLNPNAGGVVNVI